MTGQGPLSLQFSGLSPVLSVDPLFRLVAGLVKFQESYPGLEIGRGFYRFLMTFFFFFFRNREIFPRNIILEVSLQPIVQNRVSCHDRDL